MFLPKPYEGRVLPHWIDHNGHMNVAYYVLAIDESLYDFFGHFGLNQNYRNTTGCSTFTGDLHIYYKREIREGDAFTVKSILLGFDDKRIRYMSQMFRTDDGSEVAHLNLTAGRVCPMPEPLISQLTELQEVQGEIEEILEVAAQSLGHLFT